MPTILHVEDDTALADLVRLSFEGFGFRGTTLKAETVAQAETILDDRWRRGCPIDLIISDMSLPDGTGLDVVREVRRSAAWAGTPILILSGDADASRVSRAYALGANSYVTKASRGRSITDVVKTLYDHWLKDVKLPGAPQVDRAYRFLGRAAEIRGRHAAFYMRMAQQFGDTPDEASFWLSRALSEANLTNLLTFVQRQLEGRTLPAVLLDEIEQAQADAEKALDVIEQEIAAHPITTRDEAYRRLLQLVSIFDVQPYARAISYLFPVEPVAMEALVDFLTADLEELALWVDGHAADALVCNKAKQLRDNAAYLRALLPPAS